MPNKAVTLTDSKVTSIKPPKVGQEEHPDLKVTGLRVRVGTSGKKTWIVRTRAGEKMINKRIGVFPVMGLRAARVTAEKLLEAIARDGSTQATDRTFGAVAEAWIQKKRSDKTRNRSVRQQERRLERHVLPSWRERKIADIRKGDVRDLIEGIEGDVLPNRVLTVVRTVFRYALTRDWIDASPAEGVAKPKQEIERDRVLEMADAKRVWDAAGQLGYPFGTYVRALLLTGQRRTEVASMRWTDVDLDEATWLLKAADTKGRRAHVVPLSGSMIQLLKAAPRIGDQVFTTDGDTYISGFAKGKARLDMLIAARGDAPAPWTLHDLRRTVATHMVRIGVSIETVGRVLNHAPSGVTRKVYALHDFAPEKRSALDWWAAALMREVLGDAVGNVALLHG